jgi:3'-phosphoadenosine 5'-phosphosulfate sulfotransferase (PAPS reductase)/FAD synthetase
MIPAPYTPEAVAVDERVRAALQGGAVVAFSLSGGKDSGAATDGAMAFLDQIGHPRRDRIAIHADLGRAEWRSTGSTVGAVADHFGLPLMVVRHSKHDMVSRWESRFAEGKRRYADLEILNLIGPWSSASLRFCTAELKQQVISPALQKAFPGRTIVSVVGIRREESAGRRLAPVSKEEARWDRRDGSRIITWHPAVEWTTQQVFRRHERHGIPLHEAYTLFGSSRVSCAFCIMQSRADQKASANAEDNTDLYRHLVEMEVRSTFSFQPDNWLGDVAPHLLPDATRSIHLPEAKRRAVERRELEASLPAGLRYVKGWPPREPTLPEARQIIEARAQILGRHGLPVLYPTPFDVIGRFRDLMAAKSPRPPHEHQSGHALSRGLRAA